MGNDLLFVYVSPGPVDEADFTDWYDNEHIRRQPGDRNSGKTAGGVGSERYTAKTG